MIITFSAVKSAGAVRTGVGIIINNNVKKLKIGKLRVKKEKKRGNNLILSVKVLYLPRKRRSGVK